MTNGVIGKGWDGNSNSYTVASGIGNYTVGGVPYATFVDAGNTANPLKNIQLGAAGVAG